MHYKSLTRISILFIILIFISQAFLIYRLFQNNKELLNRELNLVSQEAYTMDMNSRFNSNHPEVKILKKPRHLKPGIKVLNIDEMKGIDKSNSMTLVNIGMEMFLSKKKPIRLQHIDSIATALLAKSNIHADIYSRIVDTKSNRILESSIKDSRETSLLIKSKSIPLNFERTRVLEIILLNPMKNVFSQMTGIIILSFLLSLFCVYCLYILQSTLDKQKKLAKSKNDFYNQVSHELKRPITVMFKAIDSLLNTKAFDDQKRRAKYLGISMEELNRMNGKIDMILTLSMEEEGMFNLNVSEFNLVDLIEEVREQILGVATKPVRLVVNHDLLQLNVAADRDHIYQCVSNLIENAIKYSGEQVEVMVRLSKVNGLICLSVQDDGIGIKEEDLGKIFEKFSRVGTDKKTHGFGIGLNYVKQIIEKHKGSISVRSEFGKGSEFIIQLPEHQRK